MDNNVCALPREQFLVGHFKDFTLLYQLNMYSCRSPYAIIVVIIVCNSLTNADMSVSNGSSYVSVVLRLYMRRIRFLVGANHTVLKIRRRAISIFYQHGE